MQWGDLALVGSPGTALAVRARTATRPRVHASTLAHALTCAVEVPVSGLQGGAHRRPHFPRRRLPGAKAEQRHFRAGVQLDRGAAGSRHGLVCALKLFFVQSSQSYRAEYLPVSNVDEFHAGIHNDRGFGNDSRSERGQAS